MNKINKAIENCPDIHLDNKKVLRNSKYVSYKDPNTVEAGFDMSLIGFDKNGDILAVTNWDWTVIKIKNAEFESLGRLDNAFRTIRDNPELLLNDCKVMSMKEIEEALGHKIIVREMMR